MLENLYDPTEAKLASLAGTFFRGGSDTVRYPFCRFEDSGSHNYARSPRQYVRC